MAVGIRVGIGEVVVGVTNSQRPHSSSSSSWSLSSPWPGSSPGGMHEEEENPPSCSEKEVAEEAKEDSEADVEVEVEFQVEVDIEVDIEADMGTEEDEDEAKEVEEEAECRKSFSFALRESNASCLAHVIEQ